MYVVIATEDTFRQQAKVNKKKIGRAGIKTVTCEFNELAMVLKNAKNQQAVGIITDQVALKGSVGFPRPSIFEFDALCLEGTVSRYDYKCEDSRYIKCDIIDSFHFVLNGENVQKYAGLAKRSKTLTEFLKGLQNVYIIKELYSSKRLNVHSVNANVLDVTELVKRYNNVTNGLEGELRYIMLPKVSCVCVSTNTHRTLHIVYSFLKLDYPSDHLELVILAPYGNDKELRKVIPEDEKIKILAVDKSDTSLYTYLNVISLYTSFDLICHMLDTNVYFVDRFRDFVKCYIASNKECVVCQPVGVLYNMKSYHIQDNIDIGGLLYTKRFWKCRLFDSDDPADFIWGRVELVGIIPFVYHTFVYEVDYTNTKTKTKTSKTLVPLKFKLDDILELRCKEVKDSLIATIQQLTN
ncbi:hypothetical protein EBZ38_02815 [bacterium]|nr:hypothetical protein [bacterium]